MTESSIAATGAKPPSFWEDLIDILFQPAAVFRRRQNRSPWPAILFVTVVLAVFGYVTFASLLPIVDAELSRGMAKAMAKSPELTQEMADKMRERTEAFLPFGAGPITFLTILCVGCASWLVGRLVGSAQSFANAFVVVGWAYVPRVIGGLIGAIQGLALDPAKATSMLGLSLSPARFMNADATNPLLLALLGRLDLITIWVTVLLAVGLYVTGKVSKDRAVVFGLLIWLAGSLQALQRGFVAM